ncbi:6-carboxytetrahydropterin synthase [Ligilactobacillus salivarius]
MGKIYSYRLKFYLNATHAMRWSDQIGEEHPHTWEIICQVMKKEQNHFIRFNDIEDQIQKIIEPLQNQFLNTLAPFDKTNPSLENLGIISLMK